MRQSIIGERVLATASVLTGATVWGLIWYPYRAIEAAGMGGIQASLSTYLVALVLAVLVFRGRLATARLSWWLAPIALAAGGCNIGYVLAILQGEVMRVLLLFYLSPLWTVLLSRVLLREKLRGDGALVIGLSILGAAVMLWHPERGMPWPADVAEWIALGAGFCFALQNVLIRRADRLAIELKAMAVFGGVILVALVLLPFARESPAAGLEAADWALVAVTGALLLVINLVVQYGLMRMTANQAIVICLFELVVAAVSSWLLAGEAMGLREWLGGAMIIAASLFSGRLGETPRLSEGT